MITKIFHQITLIEKKKVKKTFNDLKASDRKPNGPQVNNNIPT